MNVNVLLLVTVFLFLWAAPAHAYLDPGSGSMVLQLILGGVAGIVLVLKIFWHRILSLLGIKKKEEDRPPDSSQ